MIGLILKIKKALGNLMPSRGPFTSRMSPCSITRAYTQEGWGGGSGAPAVRRGPVGGLGYKGGLLKLTELEERAI